MARRCRQLYVSLDMAYCCSVQVSVALIAAMASSAQRRCSNVGVGKCIVADAAHLAACLGRLQLTAAARRQRRGLTEPWWWLQGAQVASLGTWRLPEPHTNHQCYQPRRRGILRYQDSSLPAASTVQLQALHSRGSQQEQ